MSSSRKGGNACRRAIVALIDDGADIAITEYGYSRQQAYALFGVAVDLKVSELVDVDVPNFIVSALLPLDIFVD